MMVRIDVFIDPRLHARLTERAADEGVTRRLVLEDALRAYLTEDPQDASSPPAASGAAAAVCGICNKPMLPGQPTWEAHGERCHESCVKYGPPE